MNSRTKATASAATAILLVAVMLASASVSSTSAANAAIPREQIVWGAGQGMTFNIYNPYLPGTTSWTGTLMYEPLFGLNVATNEQINWLGSSLTWVNATTLDIKLKSDAHWTSFGSSLVTNSTPVTADDVIYSYELMNKTGLIGTLCNGLVGGNVKTAFVKISDTEIQVKVAAGHESSSEMFRQIQNQYPIVPKAVWSVINTTYGGIGSFANDWLNASFKADWKVASGMYVPYYADTTQTIAVRNPNWWGASDSQFGRLPVPTYTGYTNGLNGVMLLALEKGDIDWDGNYIPGLSTLKAQFGNLQTYYNNLPYFPDKAADELVFNMNNYPLNQTWVHQAIMTVLNYSLMSQVDSSYLKTPNIMLIPFDDASALATYNSSIAATYTPALDATGVAGQAILSAHASYSTALKTWFTTAKVGGKHIPLAEWDGSSNATIKPWTILDFNGWTDVDAMDVIAASACTTKLNLRIVVDQGAANSWAVTHFKVNNGSISGTTGYGVDITETNDTIVTMTPGLGFDIFNMVMQGQINQNMYERYYQAFSMTNPSHDGGGGIYQPLGNFKNAMLTALISKLDNNTGAAQQAIANKIQTIIGQVLPIVPLGGHPDWEIFSNLYWTNWPNNATNKIQAAGP